MALNASTLAASIRAEILARPASGASEDTPGANTALTALCEAIAAAVVARIVADAIVTIPSGVPVATTGTAAAQTGTTTSPATGTIA